MKRFIYTLFYSTLIACAAFAGTVNNKGNKIDVKVKNSIQEEVKKTGITTTTVFLLHQLNFPELLVNYVAPTATPEKSHRQITDSSNRAYYLGIFESNPELFNLEELFQMAFFYPEGSYGFRHIFETAVMLHPTDPVANINAGAIALEKLDLRAAEKYLLPFIDDPRAWNNIGVLYMLKHEPEKAITYIYRAPIDPKVEINRRLIIDKCFHSSTCTSKQ